MAERTLQTKVKLRYDILKNWTDKNPTLLQGEIAIVAIPVDTSEMQVTGSQPPQILFKVGPGTFNSLPYASAKAADVYGWAKAATKPGYNSTEIVYGSNSNVGSALDDRYTKKEIDDKIKAIQGALEEDTNTTYRFDTSQINKILVYSKNIDSEVETKVCEFNVDFGALSDEIKGVESRVGTLEGQISSKVEENTYNQKVQNIEGRLDTAEGNITNLTNNKADKSLLDDYYTISQADAKFLTEHQSLAEYRKAVDQDIIDNAQNQTIATKLSISDFNTQIANYETVANVNKVKDDVADLKGKVGNLTGAFTFQGSLDSYDKLPTAAIANKGHVYLIGNVEYVSDGTQWILLGDEGSYVLKSTYNEHLTAQTNRDNEQNGRLDTLEGKVNNWKKLEITDITPGDGKISVDGVEMIVYNDSVLAGRVSTLEGVKHTHTNKDVLDGITSTKISNWDNAEANAKSYADGIVKTQKERIDEVVNTTIPGLDSRIQVLEQKPFDTYATKTEVEAISKDYLKSEDRTDLENLITQKVEAEAKRADGVEKGLADRIKAVEDNYLNSTDVIIWDCGGAN